MKKANANCSHRVLHVGVGGECCILPGGRRIDINGLVLRYDEFLDVARLVLSGSDLEPGDPRLSFIQEVRSARIGPGWNPGGERITFEEARPTAAEPIDHGLEDPA